MSEKVLYEEVSRREWGAGKTREAIMEFFRMRPAGVLVHRHVKNIHLKMLKLKENDVVMDLGCGPGFFSIRLAREPVTVIALDVSRNQVSVARNHHRRLKEFVLRYVYGVEGEESGTLNFVLADSESLPIRTGCIDKIVSSGVLEHTPDSDKSIREMMRSIRPGGRISCMIPNMKNPFLFLKMMLTGHNGVKGAYDQPVSEKKIAQSFLKYGATINDRRYLCPSPPFLGKFPEVLANLIMRLSLKTLEKLNPPIGAYLMLEATKENS